MTRGRKPLPQELLNLRGTERPDRRRPTSTLGDPIKLEEIGSRCQVSGLRSATRRAREIYWSQVRKVAAQGMLDEAFLGQLFMYAVEWDHLLSCLEDIKRNGIYITVEGKKGTFVIPNPAVKQRDKAMEILCKIGSNFGFSPVDRQRIKISEGEDKGSRLKGVVALLLSDEEQESPEDQ
jgi:P27 family predicted phage terminase small subunit